MLKILTDWRQYFQTRHEGLGTTYERFILNQHFERIKQKYAVNSIVEVPSFGMTGISGINSLWWAAHDCDVTVVDNNKERIDLIQSVWKEKSLRAKFVFESDGFSTLPLENDSFDMGWNFASLWFVKNPDAFLSELSRVCRKLLFICIPNTSNPFFQLFVKLGKHPPKFRIENINAKKIFTIMNKLNWRLTEQGYFDVPPWPDIAMNKEDILPFFRKQTRDKICILDYLSGKRPFLNREVLRFTWLENAPLVIKKFWAHNQYFVFQRIERK